MKRDLVELLLESQMDDAVRVVVISGTDDVDLRTLAVDDIMTGQKFGRLFERYRKLFCPARSSEESANQSFAGIGGSSKYLCAARVLDIGNR